MDVCIIFRIEGEFYEMNWRIFYKIENIIGWLWISQSNNIGLQFFGKSDNRQQITSLLLRIGRCQIS